MTERADFMIDRPQLSQSEKNRVMDSDILSDVLRAVRLSGAVFFDVHASMPWVAAAPPSREIATRVMPGAQHVIEYHALVSGSCWARLLAEEEVSVQLSPGSVVVFPQGDPHVLSSEPDMRAVPDLDVFDAASREQPLPFYLDPGGGGPQAARLVCGFLGCDAQPFNPLIQALPRMLHVAENTGSEEGWLGHLIEATLRESQEQRIGGGGMLAKLSELIFIEAIRRYAETQGNDDRSWLAGLSDPHVGHAIRLLHREPARAWSLTDLAKEVGVSRTVLAERFTDHIGMPPIAYLKNWRMQMAAGMLAQGSQTLARIAAKVGYESEAAFSRAFKRTTGLSPSDWRRTQEV